MRSVSSISSLPVVRSALLASSALIWSGPALAQDQAHDVEQSSTTASPADDAAQPPSEAPAPNAEADIVVTARGRNETLLGVPLTVSVVGPDAIARNNATDLSKIAELTPTVIVGAYKANGGGSIAIRGISSPANQTGFEQAVSVAIDGVQTSDGRISQLGFFDIDQVEVLKGPQALFFGKNSSAGVISVRTADPTKQLQIGGRASYEFVGDEITLDGYVAGPLTESVGARLAIRYRNLDGWLRNTAQPRPNPFYSAATGAPVGAAQLPGASDPRPGDEEILGRLTLKADLSPSFTARFKLLYARGEDSGPGVSSQNIGPCPSGFPRFTSTTGVTALDTAGECEVDNRTAIGDVPPAVAQTMINANDSGRPFGHLRAITAGLELGWNVSDTLLLSSRTGYNKLKYHFFSGFDQTSFSQLAFSDIQRNSAFSQEVRLTSNFEGPSNFMIGGYYQEQHLFDTNDNKTNDADYRAAVNRFVQNQDLSHIEGRTISVFAQATFEITPELELAGGARYTEERKDFDKRNLYGIGVRNTGATVFPGSDEVGVLKGHFEDSNISPEVSFSYRPTSNQTFYIAYKTGFKSGGFGATTLVTTTTRIADADFESEQANGFEVGAKGLFLDRRLRLTASAFTYKFSNLQVNTFNPAIPAFTINNAGEVRQKGAELEANFKASQIVSLHSAVAYTRNRFHDFIGQCYGFAFPRGTTRAAAVAPPNCGFVNATALTLQQDFEGRAPARSPDWAGNAGFVVDVPIAGLDLGITGDAFYSSGYFAAETQAPSTYQPDFWRFNASVSLASEDDRWTLSLVGRNLTNKYYLLFAADRTGGTNADFSGIGQQRGVVARGREVALQLGVKF